MRFVWDEGKNRRKDADTIRIVSARRTTLAERRRYEETD